MHTRAADRGDDTPERLRVLIVDDEELNLEMFSALLGACGYDVSTARDAQEALRAIAERRPDAVLLDVYLPGEDGISVCRRLKADPRTRMLPVIAITGRAERSVMLRCLEAGADEFLTKPVEKEELLLRLRNILAVAGVDELRRQEARLSTSLGLNRMILDSLPFAALLIEYPSRRVLEANRAARDRGGIPGDPCHVGFGLPYGGASSSQCGICRADDVMSRGKGTTLLQGATAGRVWQLSWVPVRPDAYLHFAEDVTERCRMEERLRVTSEMEVVGRIAAGVAHEVRNPLHALVSLTEALCGRLPRERGFEEFGRHIKAQVERLGGLMHDLLDLGKPSDPERFVDASVGALCADAVELWVTGGRAEKTPVLIVDLGGAAAKVRAEPARISQVLLNLVENAARHAPGSPVEIRLPPPEGAMARILVADGGPGIPEDLRERIFDPFFSTGQGGTGLGLSIVRNVVASHEGRVRVTNNRPGPGCTFEIILPCAAGGCA